MGELTHASFFSGVGGLDMGLERAGWRTVSFSEIDPYASAVLRERWPGVPNLGDIVQLAHRHGLGDGDGRHDGDGDRVLGAARGAVLWSGGFPCTDLSVAGKRAGMGVEGARTRSGLAYAFLELVGRHHPRFVLLENVPGLLSSHGGRDMAALVGALVELGYGVGYRVLDARHFGVPQRRRRVFILGITPGGRAGAECAAEVLSVGSRCRRHPPTGVEAGEGTSGVLADGATSTRTVQSAFGHHGWTLGVQDADGGYLQLAPLIGRAVSRNFWQYDDDTSTFLVERPSPDPDGMRAPNGLAGRSHDRDGLEVWQGHGSNVGPFGALRRGNGNSGGGVPFVAETLNSGGNSGGFRTEPGAHLVADVHPTLRRGAHGDPGIGRDNDHDRLIVGGRGVNDDPLLPLGLDSHRYRCCGNGVVSDVAFWIGERLAAIA